MLQGARHVIEPRAAAIRKMCVVWTGNHYVPCIPRSLSAQLSQAVESQAAGVDSQEAAGVDSQEEPPEKRQKL